MTLVNIENMAVNKISEISNYTVVLYRERYSGMIGGGPWHKVDDSCIPCGIIIKQDPINKYVEGVYLNEILKSILEQYG